ncbi:receptor expression-enhancing protein 2 isoform X2 [Lithobates pipiens]
MDCGSCHNVCIQACCHRSPPITALVLAARPASGSIPVFFFLVLRQQVAHPSIAFKAGPHLPDWCRDGVSGVGIPSLSSPAHRRPSRMVSWIISRLVVLLFGTLYPAYSSYKAVKTKNVKEYVKWMMYWIVFAFFTTAETLTDIILSWFPFYFELKIAFVIWLLSPYTKGSSVLYRKFVHPTLSSKEKEIDEYIAQARDKSYETMMRFGKRGLNIAANAAVTAATKGQGVLSEKLRSFSMQDLTLIQEDDAVHLQSPEPRLRSASSGLVESIVDPASTTCPAPEDQRHSVKSDGEQSEVKTEQSDEDATEKVPKRTASVKSVKKVTKVENKNVKVRPKKKTTGTTVPGESA